MFTLFIKLFIERKRQERWIFLSRKNMNKVSGNLKQLEFHLDRQYCTLIENNAVEAATAALDKYNLDEGFFISFDEYEKPHEIKRNEWGKIISDKYIIIYPESNFALYFHHEGWIWICDRSDKRVF